MAYIPFPAYYDDAPLDLSFVYEKEKPAGKHGFLKCDGSRFRFEDGTVGRFWGVNFNGGANFPEASYSEKVARRLAKYGVNLVRLHQLDAEWDTPNLFQCTKGPRFNQTTQLDPESMKRLDYLIYCLKEQGIYIYMDIFTYRKFKSGDGVANAELLEDAAKPYSSFDPHMIALQKKLAGDVWNHFNPYTGLCYKDDPVFVMCEVVNESDLFFRKIKVEPYVSLFRSLFREWLDEKGIAYPAESCDLECYDEPLVSFKIELTEKYYREMCDYMRSIGVKIPLNGTNDTVNWNTAVIKPNLVTDFSDNHEYFYDWQWHIDRKACMNVGITQVKDANLAQLALMRLKGMPFFVSEWDMPWPNAYRAESPILYAAVGAYQGWSGFAIHTYAYGTRLADMKILGKEVSSQSIGGTAYREGIFSTWNDPAKFGLFYHAALITRRGDIAEGEEETVVHLKRLGEGERKSLYGVCEQQKVSCSFTEGVDEDIPLVDLEKGEVRSDHGQLYRNWNDNYGTIDSPRTKCVYGFLGKQKCLELQGLSVCCKTDFAVIAVSSLSDDSLQTSEHMLLTAVGRARNQDAVFDGDVMLSYGHAPIEIEVIEADLVLKTSVTGLKVWAVNAEGFYVGLVPSYYEGDSFHIKLGQSMPSMYYLIQKE